MRNPFLSQINQLADWRPISKLLNKRCLKQATTPKGTPSYPPLLLFKILLLETWYGLSDREVKERIKDSISWSNFLKLDLTNASPGHSTICRFRLELVDKELAEEALILADKGYTSKQNRSALKALKLEDGIMRKATRGKPLAASQKYLNSLISATRWVIERTFGSIIRRFHGGTMSLPGPS